MDSVKTKRINSDFKNSRIFFWPFPIFIGKIVEFFPQSSSSSISLRNRERKTKNHNKFPAKWSGDNKKKTLKFNDDTHYGTTDMGKSL